MYTAMIMDNSVVIFNKTMEFLSVPVTTSVTTTTIGMMNTSDVDNQVLNIMPSFDLDKDEYFKNLSRMIIPTVNPGSVEKISRKLPKYLSEVECSTWYSIMAYIVIFVVAAIGNGFVLVSTYKRPMKPMNRLLLHLSIADVEVVFMVAAVEIFWRIHIGWYAGNIACKVVQFLRLFGLYLSSLVLICISLDRYYAIVFPLQAMNASKRVKWMLGIAWISAAIFAIPQCIIFRVENHPFYREFTQCQSISLGPNAEVANTIFSLSIMYFLPLAVIIFSYGNILRKISVESHETSVTGETQFLRRNDSTLISRAKIRTLKLTIVIVIVFLFCWTPYVVISMWHMIDRASAEKINGYIQDALFIMAVANSTFNPIVYGLFHRKKKSRPANGNVSRSGLTATTAAEM